MQLFKMLTWLSRERVFLPDHHKKTIKFKRKNKRSENVVMLFDELIIIIAIM